jgi:hypothetical protein
MNFFTKKIVVGGLVVLTAGGIGAAAVIPVIAAPAGPGGGTALRPHATKPHTSKGHHHPIAGALVRATVKETGLDRQTVIQRLEAGQTINQIAGSKAGAVENDVLAALQTRLDRAIDHGKITKPQEAALLAKAKTRVEKLMGMNLSSFLTGATKMPTTSSGAATGASL